MSKQCGKCSKTVYANEKMEAADNWYHKGCFKCVDEECGIQLNLKNFKAFEGQVYCDKHVPKPTATAVADPLSVQHATSAPKKTAEGLHKVQVGTGEKPHVGLEDVSLTHALHAPKKVSEGLHKVQVGTGEVGHQGLDDIRMQHALAAPKKPVENIGNIKKDDIGRS